MKGDAGSLDFHRSPECSRFRSHRVERWTAGLEKAIKLCPPQIAGPALDQMLMADKIRDQYGMTKERHSLRELAAHASYDNIRKLARGAIFSATF